MEKTIITNEVPEGKIFTAATIRLVTFVGGPIATAYCLAENFKTFNQPETAKKTWLYGGVATFFILLIIMLTPVPAGLIPFINMAIAEYILNRYQKDNIETHLNAEGKEQTTGKGVAALLIGLASLLILGFAAAVTENIISNKIAKSQIITKTYGTLSNNKISFNKKDFSDADADKIAHFFTKIQFFNNEKRQQILLKQNGTNMEVLIACNKNAKEILEKEPETLQGFKKLKNELQKEFADRKIVLILIVDNFDNPIKRIE